MAAGHIAVTVVLTEIHGIQNLLRWDDDTPYDEWCEAMTQAGHRYSVLPEMRTHGTEEATD